MTDCEVNLMWLAPSEYATLRVVNDGPLLTEQYPSGCYIMGINEMLKILEISPTITPAMMDLCFDNK